MSIAMPLTRIPVGVVVERRKAVSRWTDVTWHPLKVLAGVPAAEPWSVLSYDATAALFYAGATEIELYRTETGNYKLNLETETPSLWIVLRPTGSEPPFALLAVTADPSEGEFYTQNGNDLVARVPMPEAIAQIVTEFVARHHVERSFHKRKRDRTDGRAMAGPRTTYRIQP
jgi:hypothetical protein